MADHGLLYIVEDDFLLAEEMSGFLEEFGYKFRILTSGEEAVSACREKCPDGILMDIQLSGKIDGIDAVREIRQFCQVPVIFLTANSSDEIYDRSEAISDQIFIPKPVSRIQLKRMAQQLFKKKSPSEEPDKTPAGPLHDSLFLKKEIGNEAYFRIPLEQIAYLQSNRSYCIIHLHDGTSHLESHPLKQVFEEILSKKHRNKFVRVHKSYAINTDYIHAYEGNYIKLKGDTDIPIGQTYREQVRQLFN